MKITLRLTVSLVAVAALVVAVTAYQQVEAEKGRLTQELQTYAALIAGGLNEPVQENLVRGRKIRIRRLLENLGKREQLTWVAVFDSLGGLLDTIPGIPQDVREVHALARSAITTRAAMTTFANKGNQPLYLYVVPLKESDRVIGVLAVIQDASHISEQINGILQRNFARFLIFALLIIVTTVLVVRWSIAGPIAQLATWMRGLRLGKTTQFKEKPPVDLPEPISKEFTLLANSLAMARAAVKQEARLRLHGESLWTAERLKEHIRREFKGKTLFVVSNREPYSHIKRQGKIECIIPAGGLVTALDPVMRACEGVWIAAGSGDADRETADEHGRLRVPPDEPHYTLRRVWLTREEEEGYYYGFSNEGIWPLCHIAHTRPLFRLQDWNHYQNVNKKFADVVINEIAGEEEPIVLVQDYHFALLPALIKAQRPDARVGIFWHIPWPNPEAFGICPWKEELLSGLLGADLIGFHIQYHCNNFLETVDQFLESKIDWERFSVERKGQVTYVKPLPISVAFPRLVQARNGETPSVEQLRATLLKEIGVRATYIAVGVDRIDYTKGIVERCRGVERFLEKYPQYIEQLTFVELGAPSRTLIKRYHDLVGEIEELVDRINWRFQTRTWKPIVFLKAHHSHETIDRWYQASHVCVVTSLHDGMNLVAKEFVVARDDGDGVLIASQFTGVSRELHDALIVNPYDIEQLADTMYAALTMKPEERKERMKNLRETVKERNVYRWAANQLTTLVRLRVPKTVEETAKIQ